MSDKSAHEAGLQARWASEFVNPAIPPSWLTEADLDFYAGEFARTGFSGALNWYRNIDCNWELLAPFLRQSPLDARTIALR